MSNEIEALKAVVEQNKELAVKAINLIEELRNDQIDPAEVQKAVDDLTAVNTALQETITPSTETPVETPVEVPVETPVEVPVEVPVETPVETPPSA